MVMLIIALLVFRECFDGVFNTLVDQNPEIVAALAVRGRGVQRGDLRDGEEGDVVAGVADDGLVEEFGVACYEEVAFGLEHVFGEGCEGVGEVYPEGGVCYLFLGFVEGGITDRLGVYAFLEDGVYTVELVWLVMGDFGGGNGRTAMSSNSKSFPPMVRVKRSNFFLLRRRICPSMSMRLSPMQETKSNFSLGLTRPGRALVRSVG